MLTALARLLGLLTRLLPATLLLLARLLLPALLLLTWLLLPALLLLAWLLLPALLLLVGLLLPALLTRILILVHRLLPKAQPHQYETPPRRSCSCVFLRISRTNRVYRDAELMNFWPVIALKA
jgi:hypothetical protein